MKAQSISPRIRWAGALAAVVLAAAACSGGTTAAAADPADAVATTAGSAEATTTTITASNVAVTTTLLSDAAAYSAGFDDEDRDADEGTAAATVVGFDGTAITVDGGGATVDGNTLVIYSAGTFRLGGTLSDGQVVVDADAGDTVHLVLAGASITSSTTAAIYGQQADRVILTLAAGTDNYLTDASAHVYPSASVTEPNAALFSNDDLTINGTGSLTVTANYNDGISSDDELKVVSGTIVVTAADEGLRGKDSVAIGGGSLTITAGGDGIKASNDEDPEQGWIVIDEGVLMISAGGDGIQAETALVVRGGDLTIRTGGGASGAIAGSTDSSKGLKAGAALLVTGGSIDVEAADDAVHSDGTMAIGGGDLVLSTADDGLHAETSILISEGTIDIVTSYEGIESASITIDGGEIHLTSTDDGINTVGAGTSADQGHGGPAGMGGPGGEGGGDSPLYVNGGYLYIDARGDGIDANGPVEMAGGTVIVNGPTADMNGALDFSRFTISGGFLVAVGSAGMAMAPDQSSPQAVAGLAFRSAVAAGTMVHIESEAGEDILTFVPTKDYATVVVSSPDLQYGTDYVVYTGGSSTGTETDGLLIGGAYTAGTEAGTFTL